MRSPWGRVLKSIREDEDAARALGKNVVAFKMQSLILGGLIGSIGGLMLAAQTQAATPGQFATNLTFFCLHDHHHRRPRPGEGADRRHDHLLLRDPVRRQRAQPGDAQRQASRLAGRRPTTSARSSSSSPAWSLAVLVVFRPQGIFGDRREQVFDVR